MTYQSGASGLFSGSAAGGVLGGTLPNPTFATNGTTPILGVVSNVLSADVPMATANVYVDGPSVALTAGTWLLVGSVTVEDTVSSGDPSAKLWDGTTVLASGQGVARAASRGTSMFVAGVYVATGAATVKISAADNDTNAVLKATLMVNPGGNTASYLVALRIA